MRADEPGPRVELRDRQPGVTPPEPWHRSERDREVQAPEDLGWTTSQHSEFAAAGQVAERLGQEYQAFAR